MGEMRSGRRATALVGATLSALLAGCAVGPDYREPQAAVPQTYVRAEGVRYSAEEPVGQFWTVFDDAGLDRLVSDALAANQELRIATARLDEARALRGAARLDLGPAVTAGAGYTERRVASAQAGGGPRDTRGYAAGFDAFWELDFFGRTRRELQARNAQLDAAQAGVFDAQVAITAEVARTYFDLRGNQLRLTVARRNVDNQGESLALTRARLDAGSGTELDTARATAQLTATRASIAPLEAAVARNVHTLGVLTGRPPAALRASLELPSDLPVIPALTAVGSPADLLRRRPDIRISERELAAATARVGVAIADLFPRVTFTGTLGRAAGSIDALGDRGSDTHLIAPGISWAAFDLGQVRAQIAASRARNDGALARYQQTVLRALQETEDALVTHARARERLGELEQSAAASRTAARLARLRFENGAVDFLQVLDAERSLLEAEDGLAQGRTDTATSLVSVYKALGGGWVQPPPAG